jgi:hypothetical protein
MKMMTPVPQPHLACNIDGEALSGRKCFLDERGRPSERSGPDLRKAEPIEQVITRLRKCRNAFAMEFWQACKASGIDLSITIWKNGEEDLRMGFPMDCQAALRKPRGDALGKLLSSTERRREQVMELVYMLGRFADNQPFASVEEAADQLLSAGGRIWIWPDGQLEYVVPVTSRTVMEESWSGYPRRRLEQRLAATLRQSGAKEEMTALIRDKGILHAGSGTIVLSVPDSEKEKSQ